MADTAQIGVDKNGHRWVIRFDKEVVKPGDVIEAIAKMVEDASNPLDINDGKALVRQVTALQLGPALPFIEMLNKLFSK
jgi:hypothetical protein